MQLFSAAAGLDTTKEDYWYKYNKMRLKELVDASNGYLKRDYSAEKIGGTKGRPYKPVRIPKKQLDTKSKNDKMLLKLDLQYFAERDLQRQNSNSIKRSIRKLSKRREEHKTYLVDPYEHAPDWDNLSEKEKQGLRKHWNKEIRNFTQQIEERKRILKERGDYEEDEDE